MHKICNSKTSVVWIVTDGKIGTEKQCIALAEALKMTPIIKRIQVGYPEKILPPAFWFRPLSALKSMGDILAPPWPDMIIGASRKAVGPLAALKKKLQDSIFIIFIQNPKINPKFFDVIIAPSHDNLSGPNVIPSQGALHNISPERLKNNIQKWESSALYTKFNSLPKPWIALLIGGNSKHFKMTPALMNDYGALLVQAYKNKPFSLLITASRRTPNGILKEFLESLKNIPYYIWDGSGDNPYEAYLTLADFILITNDSVSMLSEASATGKPIYTLNLLGQSKKFDIFHKDLLDKGIMRPFKGSFDDFQYTVPQDMALVIKALSLLYPQ